RGDHRETPDPLAANWPSSDPGCDLALSRPMTVGFAVIGSGYMGRTYAAGLSLGRVPGGRLVAVAGGRRADGVAREFGVTAAATIGEVLERSDVDAVIIATPHTTHLPIARAAAAAGKHVYTEKPMAVSVEDCDAMIAACRAA